MMHHIRRHVVGMDSLGWVIALEQRGTGTAGSVGAYMIIEIFSLLPVRVVIRDAVGIKVQLGFVSSSSLLNTSDNLCCCTNGCWCC